ncbi:hypothetical protein Leryth_025075 [Lithospermum erythrorhizon]|nr:hypothetical protein Leryth_025075 [Lithospermum erythrorhizon]
MNPMLKLAKLLHSQGFHVTLSTEFNYNCLAKAQENQPGILDLPALVMTMPTHSKKSFKEFILRLNNKGSLDSPPVSCIVSDGVGFTLKWLRSLGFMRCFVFMLGYLHFGELKERGYFPLKGTFV